MAVLYQGPTWTTHDATCGIGSALRMPDGHADAFSYRTYADWIVASARVPGDSFARLGPPTHMRSHVMIYFAEIWGFATLGPGRGAL